MSKKALFVVLVVLIALGTSSWVMAGPAEVAAKQAEEQAAREAGTLKEARAGDPAVKKVDRRATPAPIGRAALATIQYDDGVVTSAPATSSFCYGNRFDTSNGSPLVASGNLTGAQFYMAGTSGNAFVSWFDQLNTGAGTANFITSGSKTVAVGWNTITTAQAYVGSSVLGGVWYFGGDTVGLGTGTTGAQGHHGMLINDIAGDQYSALTTVNALFRASGNPLPVELMSFSVED